MESVDFHSRIRAAWHFLYERAQIARTVSSLHSLQVDSQFSEIALDSESSYRDIYMAAISRSHYNILLADYSVFQYSYVDRGSWRLAYLPNPWTAGVVGASELINAWEGLEALGQFDDEIVSGLISEMPYYASIPPIRFEYAVNQYKEIVHPAAHLHIGRHTENRWPLARLLDPLTFSMVIAKLYYPSNWAPCSAFHGSTDLDCADLRLIEALQNSQLVHEFTENERCSLHLASQGGLPPTRASNER
jgi:hypothetical protein